jgi:anti-sigma B factor antagonist
LGSDFTITIRRQHDATVLALSGELDLASCPRLEHAIDRALESGARLVVVELEQLEFMDVAGLRSMVRSEQRARGTGTRLVVAGPRAAVTRLLSLTHQESALEVVASTAEALV